MNDILNYIMANSYIMLLVSFILNAAVVFIVTHCFYFPKSHRRDYYFTFILMSIATFLLLYTLNDVKLKSGIALGLFAIFSIIRFRTESMPVREMTYLFVIIASSVINAMFSQVGGVIPACDVLIVLAVGVCEFLRNHQKNILASKLVAYDRIDLIKPEKRDEMIKDLTDRTGLEIVNVEVGHIDFLKDSAMLKVFYKNEGGSNSVDRTVKFPKPDDEDGDDD